MPQFVDLTGHQFGRLTVLSRAQNKNGRTEWRCRCSCGNEITTSSNSLRRGHTLSCGCLHKELAAKRAKKAGDARGKQLRKHGMSGSRLYNIWKAMRERCNNPNDKYYSDYGGRGISICSEWDQFENFYKWAITNGYSFTAAFGECTIDRINVNGNYSPDNCRWVSFDQQANNRRKRRCTK